MVSGEASLGRSAHSVRQLELVEGESGFVVHPALSHESAITWAELRWLGLVCLAILALVEVPYLVAYAHEARGLVFIGLLWSPHDIAQYLAAMRDGANSTSWLIQDRLTSEPHRAVLMYPFYVGLGKLASLLGLSPSLAFHLTELVARSALLVAIYVFASAIFRTVNERRRALLVVVFSGGLGFWLLALDTVVPFIGERRSLFALDLHLPDVSTFLALYVSPHNLLGLALLLLAAHRYLAAWSRPGVGIPVQVALAVLGVGFINPFSLITLCTILSAHLVLMRLRRGAVPWTAVWCVGAAILAAAPFVLYSWLIYRTDPFWSVVYGQQNVTPSPPLAFLVLSLVPILVLGAVGLPSFVRGATPGRMLVLVWILASLLLMYAPVGYQRRFGFGLHPMLALVAAAGLAPFWRREPQDRAEISPRQSPLLTLGLLLALFSSAACSYGLRLQAMSRPDDLAAQGGAFHPVALREAGQWLASTSGPNDLTLAQAITENYLATLIPGRVFVGHQIATLRFEEKDELVRRFYASDSDDRARRDFLSANHIRYVVYGPHERAADSAWTANLEYLRPVYSAPEVVIYEVEEAASG